MPSDDRPHDADLPAQPDLNADASGPQSSPPAPVAGPGSGRHGTAYPVFYDESLRRRFWFARAASSALLLFSVGVILFVVSVLALRLMPPAHLPKPHVTANDFGNPDPLLTDRQRRQLGFKQVQDKRELRRLEERRQDLQREHRRAAAEFLHLREAENRAAGLKPAVVSIGRNRPGIARPAPLLPPAPVPNHAPPIVAGFYVNWEETSPASAHRNINALTHLIPEWLHLKPGGSDFADPAPNVLPFVDARLPSDKTEITLLARAHGVGILPLINNYTQPKGAEEGVGNWDAQAVHQIVSNPRARANVIARLRNWLVRQRMQGVNVDFEEIRTEDRAGLVTFMKELYAALHPLGLRVTEDIELENDSFDVPNLAKWNDWIVPMFYDENTAENAPGPVAGVDWTAHDLNALLKEVPAGKIVMGVANHGYDWTVGKKGAASVTYQSAVISAKEAEPDVNITLDPRSLNPKFTYLDTETDANGKDQEQKHVVWMQDAVSVYNQLQLARPQGIRGAALWYLGAEDPSLWNFFTKSRWDTDWRKLAADGALDTITYGGQAEVDFEGDGELLQPTAAPSDGRRTTTLDPKTGFITAESYLPDPQHPGNLLLPSSYVVRRYGGGEGNPKKEIVLSFDDGPDPQWTPQILDILKQYHVPGVFFVVGKNAESYPDIIRRMWDEGQTIGNHSWDHPDLFRLSALHQHLELTTTQRVIQAVTGHSTSLFRPPYGGDKEPDTGKQVSPLLTAAGLGFITVGETNDPQDYRLFENKPGTETADVSKPRSAEDIVKSVVVNRDAGVVVLLHDAGGDRSRTVAALPQIITQLRALGYKFISVAQYRGETRDKLMPRVTGNDVLLVGADRYLFEVTYVFQRILTTLFTLSVVLGISRVVIFLVLALIQRVRERRRVYPAGFAPSVSVVIAAYNEEKVIVRTVQALLESAYPNLEIIVVDDGSKDNTSEAVQRRFVNELRVRLFRKENGGKASALNVGIAAAKGEILVSLDADTLFAPDTIERLVRHFSDPKVGAVSGNVRVGNARNLFTRWQALEYITSQNFDRRGYDLLNCITVVPGAVGALRREAVMDVGGYTSDTLAEDTDLTWKLRRAGWRIVNDNTAMAYTEAPETLRNLAKQRFRWAFGTLQCLWKHQAALFRHGAFGWVALPSLWLYQILFPAVSPFMDVAMVWSIFAGNFAQFLMFFALMFGIDLLAATVAIRMDRGDMRLLLWLFFQRFLYRQLMYYVILKSLAAAIRGGAVGWGKFERTGTARIEGKAA